MFPIVKMLLGKRLEKRVKVHPGWQINPDQLDKFGLYDRVLPEDIGGKVVLDHAKWLEDRRVLGK